MTDRDRPAELKQLAHDVRNALNGVSINLEVARNRAHRGIEVAQLISFIDTAAQQLEAATRLHKRYSEIVTDLAAQTVAPGVRSTDSTTHPTPSRS